MTITVATTAPETAATTITIGGGEFRGLIKKPKIGYKPKQSSGGMPAFPTSRLFTSVKTARGWEGGHAPAALLTFTVNSAKLGRSDLPRLHVPPLMTE